MSSVLVRLDGERPEVHLPLVEDAALVAPGPNLPALGRSLRHPKAPQKTEGTYAQAHTFLLGHHMCFLGNPRAASTWAVSRDKFPVGMWTMSCRANTVCPARCKDVLSLTSWDAGPKAEGRGQFQRQCQPPKLSTLIVLFLDYLCTHVIKFANKKRAEASLKKVTTPQGL